MTRLAILLAFLVHTAAADLVRDVRAATRKNDFASAEKSIEEYRKQNGATPEMIEAVSWLGRGALAAKQPDKAAVYAAETRKLALEALNTRRLDDEKRLPLALGASIEVEAQAMAARGERDRAVVFLNRELKAWRQTSIRTRIQKNLNLLALEGKPAPPLDIREHLGPKPQPLASLKGRPVLLFFWAHWCGDCKGQAPILARLAREYPDLAIVGPTQRYGYAARGEDASPERELKYIDEVRREHYSELSAMPVPVNEETFRNYGASTTPTLVLVDRAGVVRMYHPGAMTYEELAGRLRPVISGVGPR